ncbi:MAG: flagellar hook-associated protein FlgK [Mycobacterium sp.]|nr:flagellar hook-associated protein FlgK [Mycobacterium sp.]
MSLASALAIATGGLTNVTSQLAVVSQNVSNANTAGYTREIGQQTALSADGLPLGVLTGPTVRSINTTLQAEAWQQDATVAGMTVTSTALSAIDSALGTPGDDDDLASLTGALNDAFTTLSANPSSSTEQTAVVTAASNLTNAINSLAQAVGTQRQTANDSVIQETSQLNTALASIGTLSTQISSLSNQGTSTAALEDQRDAAMSTVAQLTGASFVAQSDGSVQVILPSGTTLPTDGSADIQLAESQLMPQFAARRVTLDGRDITSQLTGGSIGANLTLRDTTMPTVQAELDEFSHDLATQFSAAGLQLFTDGSATVAPAATTGPVQAGYLGLANKIQVNPAVTADPSLVQQGTGGTTIDASDQTVIDTVLNQAFGPASAASAPAPQVRGLGQAGTLSAPFSKPRTLADFASDIVSAESSASSDASASLTTAQAAQTTLNNSVAAVSGVSVDTEMSTMIGLQNAYAASARVITAVQSMWTSLLDIGTTP